MKRFTLFACLALLSGLALGGCHSKSSESSAGVVTEEIGPKYSASSGLRVPEETRKSLGLQITEVTEQKVPATLDIQLRVYRAGKEATLASATISPEEAKTLKLGQAVRAHSGKTVLTGVVVELSDQLQKASGTVEVLVELQHTLDMATPDAFLPASIVLDSAATVVSIPRDALLANSEGHSVYTVSGEYFIRTPVKVGALSDKLVEIKDGLYPGDQVVLTPVMALWMTELAAVKGGQACCAVPTKGK